MMFCNLTTALNAHFHWHLKIYITRGELKAPKGEQFLFHWLHPSFYSTKLGLQGRCRRWAVDDSHSGMHDLIWYIKNIWIWFVFSYSKIVQSENNKNMIHIVLVDCGIQHVLSIWVNGGCRIRGRNLLPFASICVHTRFGGGAVLLFFLVSVLYLLFCLS